MLLSIVIPAYNAERTLERTVRAVLAQTFKDFELLIVNNGSKDATGDIAKRLAAEDPRIRTFDVYPNIWGYGARLYGWKRARGDYIASVDADDLISPEMYETMLSLATSRDLDVVECDYDEMRNGQGKHADDLAPDDVTFLLSRQEVIDRIVLPTFVGVGKSAYVWNKIYRNRYDFSAWKDGVFGSYEDLIHNLQLYTRVSRVGHLAVPFYHYLPNAASVTRTFSVDRIEIFRNAVKAKKDLVGAYGVGANDPVVNDWILNDTFNLIRSISSFGRYTVKERFAFLKTLLSVDVVREALNGPARSPRSRLVKLINSLKSPFVILAIRTVCRLRGK